MPYKNPERQREYMRNYAKRKRLEKKGKKGNNKPKDRKPVNHKPKNQKTTRLLNWEDGNFLIDLLVKSNHRRSITIEECKKATRIIIKNTQVIN